MLFRTGAKGFAAHVPRDATPIFFPEKENGRRPSKRKAFYIASEQLEELQCLPIALPIARRCRVWSCYTICHCFYHPLLRSRWRLCCLTDAAHPLRVPLCSSCRSTQ